MVRTGRHHTGLAIWGLRSSATSTVTREEIIRTATITMAITTSPTSKISTGAEEAVEEGTTITEETEGVALMRSTTVQDPRMSKVRETVLQGMEKHA